MCLSNRARDLFLAKYIFGFLDMDWHNLIIHDQLDKVNICCDTNPTDWRMFIQTTFGNDTE